MDHIWRWAWDRFRTRYSWAVFGISAAALLAVYLLFSCLIVAFERSDRYGPAAAVCLFTVLVTAYCSALPGFGEGRVVELWAGGNPVTRARALEATYAWARKVRKLGPLSQTVFVASQFLVVSAAAGAPRFRMVQYGILGAAIGLAVSLIGVHGMPESAMRPARIALTDDIVLGEELPRSRPTFATWGNVLVVAAAYAFSAAGAMLAVVNDRVREYPVTVAVIAAALAFGFAVPITLTTSFVPLLRPVRDLAKGTERVTAGDYSQPLPVVQDDDLGALAASFNRMQAGLAERRRLHAAFGTYVDPALAARLLEQGDDVFSGERREVTVMFIDIRDFTPYAESHTVEDAVARLNALFEIVVPAVVEVGGHVNKFLGDGALAVFGAPNDLADHADVALKTALVIDRRVTERFGKELRIGIGINTGVVIAGTLGGGGKLEFTLIGDAVNVAARVEQLTKTTGDTILLTQDCVGAVGSRPCGLIDRGLHALKGKAVAVQIFGIHQEAEMHSQPAR